MSPNITRGEVARLGRKRQQPVKAEGELLAVFCAGKLVNPLNASAWGWQKRSRLARKWKDAVALMIYEARWDFGSKWVQKREEAWAPAKVPKRVHFLANTGGRMDSDGLQAALKPVRDALVECGVISGDADKDGHQFVYAQRIERAQRGVTIRVSLRAPEGGPR